MEPKLIEALPIEHFLLKRDNEFISWLMDQVAILRFVKRYNAPDEKKPVKLGQVEIKCKKSKIFPSKWANKTFFNDYIMFHFADGTALLIKKESQEMVHFDFEESSEETFQQLREESRQYEEKLNSESPKKMTETDTPGSKKVTEKKETDTPRSKKTKPKKKSNKKKPRLFGTFGQ